MLSLLLAFQTPSITIPAYTGYAHDAGVEIVEGKGVRNWQGGTIDFGGHLASKGDLRISLHFSRPAAGVTYRVVCIGVMTNASPKAFIPSASATSDGSPDLAFPKPIRVDTGNWVHLYILPDSKGVDAGDLDSITLSGSAVEGAQFNLKPRRNAASVHLKFPTAERDIDAFYNEIVADTDPLHTYYMACGFRRGYFGMQVNSERERRVIFSIWDAGKEAQTRSKVSTDDQVQLLEKGEDVVAGGFGGEGTGGHSHWVYPWKAHEVQKFFVSAKPDADHTTYAAYFKGADMKAWKLIARFRAPKDGKYLSGLYSFVENFWGSNGDLLRRAEFGTPWVHVAGGNWAPLRKAEFSHDATGGVDRFDYSFGQNKSGDRFFLQNGGFEGDFPKRGDSVELRSPGSAPKDLPEDLRAPAR